jgi:hypothetical protein
MQLEFPILTSFMRKKQEMNNHGTILLMRLPSISRNKHNNQKILLAKLTLTIKTTSSASSPQTRLFALRQFG